jgi:hypothetical protein
MCDFETHFRYDGLWFDHWGYPFGSNALDGGRNLFFIPIEASEPWSSLNGHRRPLGSPLFVLGFIEPLVYIMLRGLLPIR